MEQIQIQITDDNDEIRASLRAYLESQEDMAVAGEAANGSEALRILSEKHVDVMLLDIIMPQLDGFGGAGANAAAAAGKPEPRLRLPGGHA